MDGTRFFSVFDSLEQWIRPTGIKRVVLIIILIFLIVVVYGIVYLTGGVKYVYAHTMYVPIIMSSVFFGFWGAIFAALLGGLALGPYMPITTDPLVYQEPINWLYRMGMFTFNGLIIGLFFDSAYRALKKTKWFALNDPITLLPNAVALKNKVYFHAINGEVCYIISLYFGNYLNSVTILGYEYFSRVLKRYETLLKKEFNFIENVYFLQNDTLSLIINKRENIDDFLAHMVSLNKNTQLIDQNIYYPDIHIGVIDNSKLMETKETEKNGISNTLIEKSLYLAYRAYKIKNNYLQYSEELDNEIKENFQYTTEFPKALANKQLVLFYQPKVQLFEQKIVSVEALVRWFDYNNNLIPPGKWVPIIEKTGLINDLTEFVLEEALKQIKLWHEKNINIKVSINISTFDLTQEFAFHILNKLKEYSVEPEFLELEITETGLFNNIDEAITIMDFLAKKGIVFSIDDFGTGFSSLSYLKKLPIKYLKIDQTFIRNIHTDITSQKITKATLNMSNNLNISAVAEGIENQEAEKILLTEGCTLGQGYYYSKPVPAKEFEDLYSNGINL